MIQKRPRHHLPPTKRQAEVLSFVASYITLNGYAPTLEEICEFFGITSISTAHKHLMHLQRKGLLKRRLGHSRAIQIMDGVCPACGR